MSTALSSRCITMQALRDPITALHQSLSDATPNALMQGELQSSGHIECHKVAIGLSRLEAAVMALNDVSWP